MNLIYIYIYLYIYTLISRSNIINLSVYEFINFRYMNVTLNKQVPLSDEAVHLDSYLALYDPGCLSAKIFKQCVFPFGSIASVTAFLRVSLALWKVGSTCYGLYTSMISSV